jgi:hypothetical protein
VELVHRQKVVALLDEVLVGFLAAAGSQPLDLQIAFFGHLRQLFDDVGDPFAGGLLGFLLRREPFRLGQALLRIRLCLGFLFAILEGLHLGFDEFSGVEEGILVLDVAGTDPGLDLVSQSLELFDFFFEIHLVLFLLVLLFRRVDLVPDLVKKLDALVDLFHDPIDLGCCYSCCGLVLCLWVGFVFVFVYVVFVLQMESNRIESNQSSADANENARMDIDKSQNRHGQE